MQSRIPAQEIANALSELITQAKEAEPDLAKWLEALALWVYSWEPDPRYSKKYVLAVFTEISIFAERWLLLKKLTPRKQNQFLENLNPAECYFMEFVFPAWLWERNPKLSIWKEKLMYGQIEPSALPFNQRLHRQIQNQGGYCIAPLLVDWWMNTSLIAGFDKDRCLCVQLTTATGDDLEDKLIEWEKILWHCGIKRGLLVSYDPSTKDEIDLAGTILSASRTLEVGQYRAASQEPKTESLDSLYLN